MAPDDMVKGLQKLTVTAPLRIDSGQTVADWAKFLKRQESLLEGLKEGGWAYRACLDRLQKIYEKHVLKYSK